MHRNPMKSQTNGRPFLSRGHGVKPPHVAAFVAALMLGACGQATSGRVDQRPFPDASPRVYIANISDGDTVTSPVRVVFGLSGMGVAPAGSERPKTGHHHLLIDTGLSAEERSFAIASDARHVHFGGGQTETVLNLTPGDHTLQLVFGRQDHTLFSPSIESKVITVHVR